MKISDQGGNDFEQPPVGTHVARCCKIIDIGTQQQEFEGKVSHKRQIIIGWELSNEMMTTGEYAGKPFGVSRFYTASLGEKANLRKDLTSWRGREFTAEELAGFDVKQIIGKPCMVGLTTNDKGRVRVSSVIGLPKGMTVPPQINPTVYLSLEPEEYDDDVFERLSDKMKEMIRKSPEYQSLEDEPEEAVAATATSGFDDMDDDIPF